MDDNKTIQDKPSWRSKFKWKFKYLPVRYVFTTMAFLGVCNVYILRTNLNMAIVSMVVAPSTNELALVACPHLIPKNNNTNQTKPPGEFHWNAAVQGQILGVISIGYMILPIPISIVTVKYGAKWVFGLSILIAALLTFATEAASRHSPWSLFALRFLEGLSMGVALPTMHALVGKWIPRRERSRHQSFIFSGIPFGTIVSYSVSGFLIKYKVLGGWPSVFYLSGLSGCLWFIAWGILISETPKQNMLITEAELNDTRNEVDFKPEVNKGAIPWRAILRSGPVYCLIMTSLGNNWGFYTLLNSMPTYLARVHHMDIKANGVISSMPYVMYIILSNTGGLISDVIRVSNNFTITCIRKFMNSLAFYIPALCLLCIRAIGCNSLPIVILLTLAVGFSGIKYSGFLVAPIDMTPEYAGVIVSIMSTVGQLSGFAAPAFNGWVTVTGDTLSNWGKVYYTAALILIVCGTIFNLFATAELQNWGRMQNVSKTEMVDEGNTTENMPMQPILKSSSGRIKVKRKWLSYFPFFKKKGSQIQNETSVKPKKKRSDTKWNAHREDIKHHYKRPNAEFNRKTKLNRISNDNLIGEENSSKKSSDRPKREDLNEKLSFPTLHEMNTDRKSKDTNRKGSFKPYSEGRFFNNQSK